MGKKAVADEQEVLFVSNDLEEVMEHFKTEKETDQWHEVYKKELEVIGVPNAPILAGTYAEEYETDEEKVQEAMEETGFAVKFPTRQGMRKKLLGATSYRALFRRFGLECSAMLNVDDKPKFNALDTAKKAEIINGVAQNFTDKVLVLVRDGLCRYIGSESYAILPVVDLLTNLWEAIGEQFPYAMFNVCRSGLEITECEFDLNDDDIEEKIHETVGEEGMKAMLKFVTSDVGLRAASLYPYLVDKDGRSFLIGKPLTVDHNVPKTVEMIKDEVCRVMTTFRDTSDKVEALSHVLITNVKGCYLNIAKTVCSGSLLRKSTVMAIAEDIEAELGTECTALDIWWKLQDTLLVEDATRDVPMKLNAHLMVQEAIARTLTYNYKEYDSAAVEW